MLLGLFLNAARKWAKVGDNPDPRRQRARTGKAFVLRWVYTNECSGDAGMHSHVLATIPQPAVAAFKAWTQRILQKLTGQAGDETSVDIKVRFGSEEVMIRRGWCWFRYIAKQADRTTITDYPGKSNERIVSLRDAMRLWPHQDLQPVRCRPARKNVSALRAGDQP
jgi:hypothetical protein